MATQTVAAVFDRYEDAANAVSKLEAAGVSHSDISIVSNDATQRSRYPSGDGTTTGRDATAQDAANGAGTGATVGTVVGGGAGLLAGLGLLAIPGLGPVVAAGWLVATALGAGVGAAAGGLLGSLTGAGISENDAHAYSEAVNRGGTLVTVRADESLHDRVVGILDTDGAVDMDQRQSAWRSEGWTGRYGGEPAPTATGDVPGMPGAGVGTATDRARAGSTGLASSAGAELGVTDPVDDRYAAGSTDAAGRRVRSYPQS